MWVSGDEEFTETRIYRMEREGQVSLREITKHALKKSDNLLAEGVLPYDFSKATEFQMGYLSGFYAEKRDIERKELEEEVHREVEAAPGIFWKTRFTDTTEYTYFPITSDRYGNSGNIRCFRCGP